VATANISAPPKIPTPPPIPRAALEPPPPPEQHVRGGYSIPSFATSFGFHCLIIIVLGLIGYGQVIVGQNGPTMQVAQEGDGLDGNFDLEDAGAKPGESELPSPMASDSPPELAEFSTAATDKIATLDLEIAPPSLKLELPGGGKAAKQSGGLGGLFGSKGSGDAKEGDGAGLGKGHGYGKTKFFGVEAEGNKFVYVFDRSFSMTSYESIPLKTAKIELLSSIERLQDQQQFYCVFYNHQPWPYEPYGSSRGRLHFATSENKNRFRNFLYELPAEGGTSHVPALEWAIRKKPDVIYLMTDGEEKDDPTRAELQKLTRMNSGGASIHVIQFTLEPRPDSTLVQLAKLNRGKHRFVDIQKLVDRLAGPDPLAVPLIP
jgi:hypothetical protein